MLCRFLKTCFLFFLISIHSILDIILFFFPLFTFVHFHWRLIFVISLTHSLLFLSHNILLSIDLSVVSNSYYSVGDRSWPLPFWYYTLPFPHLQFEILNVVPCLCYFWFFVCWRSILLVLIVNVVVLSYNEVLSPLPCHVQIPGQSSYLNIFFRANVKSFAESVSPCPISLSIFFQC